MRLLCFALTATTVAGWTTFAEAAQVLDQSQTLYNGGTSALNGANPTPIWQSFTAGMNGTLTEIDMGFFAGNGPTYGTQWTGTGRLDIYDGTGTGGTLLQTQTVNAWATSTAGSAPVCWNPWNTHVPSVAGHVYTFAFTPISGLPNPYGVAIGTIGGVAPYTRGAYSVDAGKFSENFRTWVNPAPVPEPGTLAAMGLGLAGLHRVRRKKAAKTSRSPVR